MLIKLHLALQLILVISCALAHQSSANSLLLLEKSLDFLEEELAAKLDGSFPSEPEEICQKLLEQPRANASELAIQLITRLARAQRCDGGSLGDLRQLSQATSGHRDSIRPKVDALVRQLGFRLVLKGCKPYLNDKSERAHSSARRLEQKFELITESNYLIYDWTRVDGSCESDADCICEPANLARIFRSLAGENKTNSYGDIDMDLRCEKELAQFRSNFDYNWKHYFALPCKHYIGAFGELAEDTFVVGKHSSDPNDGEDSRAKFVDFFDLLPRPYQDVIYRYFICKTVVANKLDTQRIYQILSQEDEANAEEKLQRGASLCLRLPFACGKRKN